MLNSNINKALEINSNKAVLLSIKKQWLEKILSGEKTIEVRKTMPWEISYPFVVFCYETKANGGAGKVTAAFVCRDINTLDCMRELPAYAIGTEVTEKTAQFVKDSCLTANELIAYGNKSGTLYCWLVGGEVVLWPYIVDGVVYNYPIVRNSIWADSKTLPDPEFQNQIMDITQKWLNEA